MKPCLRVLAMAAVLSVTGAAVLAGQERVIRSARKVQELAPARAAAGVKVELHLTLTQWHATRQWYIGQDDSGGVYLDGPAVQRLGDSANWFRPGDRVVVLGETAAGLYAPIVRPWAMLWAGHVGQPQPARAKTDELAAPSLHNRLVEVEGRVASFATEQPVPGLPPTDWLVLEADGQPLRVQLPGGSLGRLLNRLSGARVRVRGVASIEFATQGQMVGPQLLSRSAADIDVVGEAAEPELQDWKLPLEDLERLFRLGDWRQVGGRHRVRGRVVYVGAETIVIQKGATTLDIPRSACFGARLGDHLEVVGTFTTTPGGYLAMTAALGRVLEDPAPMVEARSLNAETGYFELVRGTLGELEAEVVLVPEAGDAAELEVQMGPWRIRVLVPREPPGRDGPARGDRVRIRGLLRREPAILAGNRFEELRMYVSHGEALQVIDRAGWAQRMPWRRVAAWAAIALLAAVVWGLVLRRQVRQRTAELERANAGLAAAREQAERASRAKSILLAMASHDIRNPLQAVGGLLDLAQEEGPDGTWKQHLQLASRTVESLLRLLENLLDYGRLEAGGLEIAKAPFELQALLRDVAALYEAQASARGLAFRLQLDAQLPRLVRGDSVRLRQVLANLLGNALKFTASGGIVFRASRTKQGVRFEVSDTGPGIAPEQIDAIFEPFYQVGATAGTNRGAEGAGLGLAISRQLVERMGGRLEVDSVVGRGSCFHFTLPLEEVDAQGLEPTGVPNAETVPEPSLAGFRVLVVDDSAVSRLLSRRLLERMGCTVDEAPTLAEARTRLESGARFDVILADIELPDGAGTQLATVVRRHQPGAGFVLLSAHGDPETARRASDAGADGHLVKPLDWRSLRAMLHGKRREDDGPQERG